MSPTKDSSTHYQILGVNKESSSQEIKNAFLNLSKSHHPDLHPNDPTKHKTFVRIMEAYTVLSKPGLRQIYDSDTFESALKSRARRANGFSSDFDVETDAPRYTTFRDETIWEMRNRENDKFYKDQPYYGIKGIKRMSNLVIAGGAIMLMMSGALFHFVALRKSTTFTVTQLNNRDMRLGSELTLARGRASANGNDLQCQLLEEKFAKSNGDL